MQFRLSTLLLLFVVLWSSLAVFGIVWRHRLGLRRLCLAIAQLFGTMAADALRDCSSSVCCSLAFLVVRACVLSKDREALDRDSAANNLQADHAGIAQLSSGQRLFSAGLRRRQERAAHAQLASADSALPSCAVPCISSTTSTSPGMGRTTRSCSPLAPRRTSVRATRAPRTPAATCTNYVAVVGPNAAWSGEKPKTGRRCRPVEPHHHARRSRRRGHSLDGAEGSVLGFRFNGIA